MAAKTRELENRASRNGAEAEKEAAWKAYADRKPTRVPLRWNTNPRIILLNPELNPGMV